MQETLTLLDITVTDALTAEVYGPVAAAIGRVESLAVQSNFDYGSGGTNGKAWLQTTLDGGTTWCDIANFAVTTADARRFYNLTNVAVTTVGTPSDGTLADDTAVNGVLGPLFRVKVTTTGTYAGSTTWKITVVPK